LSGRGLCDELITRAEESYRLCCVVVCDLETSRMGAPYIYDISHLRVNPAFVLQLRKITEKPSVRVRKTSVRLKKPQSEYSFLKFRSQSIVLF